MLIGVELDQRVMKVREIPAIAGLKRARFLDLRGKPVLERLDVRNKSLLDAADLTDVMFFDGAKRAQIILLDGAKLADELLLHFLDHRSQHAVAFRSFSLPC